MDSRPIGNVVIDTHGKGVGLLEYHAYFLSQQGGIHLGIVNILIIQENSPIDLNARHQVVHAVQCLQVSGLAAA